MATYRECLVESGTAAESQPIDAPAPQAWVKAGSECTWMKDSGWTLLTLQVTSKKGSEGSRPLKCACEGDGQTKHSVLGTKVALCGDSDKERWRNEQEHKNDSLLLLSPQFPNQHGMDLFSSKSFFRSELFFPPKESIAFLKKNAS